MPGIVKEFKDFISRGNVIDLAVAVVIGIAFQGVVNAIVEGLITPLVGIFAGRDFSRLTFSINDSVFRYGLVINAVLQFLAVAAAVFLFVVKPINLLQERRLLGMEPEPASPPSDEAVLLAEIRDLLRAQGGQAGPAGQAPPAPDVPPAPRR